LTAGSYSPSGSSSAIPSNDPRWVIAILTVAFFGKASPRSPGCWCRSSPQGGCSASPAGSSIFSGIFPQSLCRFSSASSSSARVTHPHWRWSPPRPWAGFVVCPPRRARGENRDGRRGIEPPIAPGWRRSCLLDFAPRLRSVDGSAIEVGRAAAHLRKSYPDLGGRHRSCMVSPWPKDTFSWRCELPDPI
jgi:hypothetical protein